MCEKESSEHLLIDFVLEASRKSQTFDFEQLKAALRCMEILSKICKEDLNKLWQHECNVLGIDENTGAVLQHDFIRIATRASLLPGCRTCNVFVLFLSCQQHLRVHLWLWGVAAMTRHEHECVR
jgi:hypothetical protein